MATFFFRDLSAVLQTLFILPVSFKYWVLLPCLQCCKLLLSMRVANLDMPSPGTWRQATCSLQIGKKKKKNKQTMKDQYLWVLANLCWHSSSWNWLYSIARQPLGSSRFYNYLHCNPIRPWKGSSKAFVYKGRKGRSEKTDSNAV